MSKKIIVQLLKFHSHLNCECRFQYQKQKKNIDIQGNRKRWRKLDVNANGEWTHIHGHKARICVWRKKMFAPFVSWIIYRISKKNNFAVRTFGCVFNVQESLTSSTLPYVIFICTHKKKREKLNWMCRYNEGKWKWNFEDKDNLVIRRLPECSTQEHCVYISHCQLIIHAYSIQEQNKFNIRYKDLTSNHRFFIWEGKK